MRVIEWVTGYGTSNKPGLIRQQEDLLEAYESLVAEAQNRLQVFDSLQVLKLLHVNPMQQSIH